MPCLEPHLPVQHPVSGGDRNVSTTYLASAPKLFGALKVNGFARKMLDFLSDPRSIVFLEINKQNRCWNYNFPIHYLIKGQQITAALFLLKQLNKCCPLACAISCVILVDCVDLLIKLTSWLSWLSWLVQFFLLNQLNLLNQQFNNYSRSKSL